MKQESLNALFSGLTGKGNVVEQPTKVKVPKQKESKVSKTPSTKNESVSIQEERFCTIVRSETLRKIRIVANREGLQIKDVVEAAFQKAISSYEKKHGIIDGPIRGNTKGLF